LTAKHQVDACFKAANNATKAKMMLRYYLLMGGVYGSNFYEQAVASAFQGGAEVGLAVAVAKCLVRRKDIGTSIEGVYETIAQEHNC